MNGKRVADSDQLSPVFRLQTQPPVVTKPSPCIATAPSNHPSQPPFGSDFILFQDDHDQPMVMGEDEEERNLQYSDTRDDDSQVVIPWTSPTTRLRNNRSVIDMFTQTYNGPPHKTISHVDAMIDPALAHYTPLPVADYQRTEAPAVSVVVSPVKAEALGNGPDQFSSWAESSDPSSAPDDSPSERRNSSATYSSHFHTPHNTSLDFNGPPAQASELEWSSSKMHRRGSDEDDHRPEKKFKSGPTEDFTDTNMPDIFRFAHPEI